MNIKLLLEYAKIGAMKEWSYYQESYERSIKLKKEGSHYKKIAKEIMKDIIEISKMLQEDAEELEKND